MVVVLSIKDGHISEWIKDWHPRVDVTQWLDDDRVMIAHTEAVSLLRAKRNVLVDGVHTHIIHEQAFVCRILKTVTNAHSLGFWCEDDIREWCGTKDKPYIKVSAAGAHIPLLIEDARRDRTIYRSELYSGRRTESVGFFQHTLQGAR
jgi:hypothetical protein